METKSKIKKEKIKTIENEIKMNTKNKINWKKGNKNCRKKKMKTKNEDEKDQLKTVQKD